MGKVHDPSRAAAACELGVHVARSVGIAPEGPLEASLLQRSHKSLVVRIQPPGEPGFVAKRTGPGRAVTEARVYDQVLSSLPEGHVDLLDRSISEENGWLFLEDAGDVAVETGAREMRREIGRLLGRFAVRTAGVTANDGLHHYTSDYFIDVLADAHRQLEAAAGGIRTAASSVVLSDARQRLHRIEAMWPAIESLFTDDPEVFCHADLRSNNMRLRGPGRDLALLDWELAGRGPLALDLGCLAVSDGDDPLIVGLGSGFAQSGRPLLESARLGRMLRLVHAMHWAGKLLATSSADRGVRLLTTYCRHVDRVFAQLAVDEGRTRGA